MVSVVVTLALLCLVVEWTLHAALAITMRAPNIHTRLQTDWGYSSWSCCITIMRQRARSSTCLLHSVASRVDFLSRSIPDHSDSAMHM